MKTVLRIALLACVITAGLVLASHAIAQDAPPDAAAPAITANATPDQPPAVDSPDVVTDTITGVVARYPWVSAVLLAVGLLRTVFKPIMGVFQSRAAATTDTADDERLARVQRSWWFRALAWLLDYSASIKLPAK